MYKCYHCGEIVEIQRLERVVCPRCGFRIFYKVRQPVIRRVKAL